MKIYIKTKLPYVKHTRRGQVRRRGQWIGWGRRWPGRGWQSLGGDSPGGATGECAKGGGVRGEGPALTNAIQDLRRNDGIRVRECGVPVRSEVSAPLGKEVITEKEPKGVLVPPRAADVPVKMRGKPAMDKPHV